MGIHSGHFGRVVPDEVHNHGPCDACGREGRGDCIAKAVKPQPAGGTRSASAELMGLMVPGCLNSGCDHDRIELIAEGVTSIRDMVYGVSFWKDFCDGARLVAA